MDTTIRIDNVNPAGVYFFTHALTTYRRYTTCTRQPSSGSPARVSATTYLNTQVSSPGLSPIRVPSMRRSGRSFAHSPKRCVQGPRHQTGARLPGHVPTATQPTPTVSAACGPQHTTNTRNYFATPGQRTRVVNKSRGSIGFGPNAW